MPRRPNSSELDIDIDTINNTPQRRWTLNINDQWNCRVPHYVIIIMIKASQDNTRYVMNLTLWTIRSLFTNIMILQWINSVWWKLRSLTCYIACFVTHFFPMSFQQSVTWMTAKTLVNIKLDKYLASYQCACSWLCVFLWWFTNNTFAFKNSYNSVTIL